VHVFDEPVAGRYEVEELIGAGAMASVYRAHDRRLERRVALKILHEHCAREPEDITRFRREARAAALLNHPNIVSVIDRGNWQGREFIVFEYVSGQNLKELLKRNGTLPVEQALELAIEIGSGLAFAHQHGLVHRDVKPQNVLVGDAGAKVTDFGIARMAELDDLTLAGTIIGTSDYISPEQANGQPASAQSDVYSLGALMFELLTGDVPFHGDGFVEVALHHITEATPNVRDRRSEVPARVADAVARAMEKDPARRYESMTTFVDELTACLDRSDGEHDSTLVLAPSVDTEALRVRARSWPAKPIAAAVIVVATAAVVAIVFLAHSHNPIGTRSAIAAAIHLHAVAAFDPPPGDGVEDNQHLALATDGNPATYWATEWYANPHFGNLKDGVGIVLDAGKTTRITALTIDTDTPGFTATIKAGPSQAGPFQPISLAQTVTGKTTFHLSATSASEYYLVWITELSPATAPNYQAHINEITAN
jgi:serine/threonine-protein kinase